MDAYIEKAKAEGRIIDKVIEPTQGIPKVQYNGDINVSSDTIVPNPAEKVNGKKNEVRFKEK